MTQKTDTEFHVSYWFKNEPGEPVHTETHARLGDALIALGGLVNDRPVENSAAILSRGGDLLMGLRVDDGQWRVLSKDRVTAFITDWAGSTAHAYIVAHRVERVVCANEELGAAWRRLDGDARSSVFADWERAVFDGLLREPRRP